MHLIGQSPVPDTLPESPLVYMPTGDRVLVRRVNSTKTTRMGLLLPENFQGKLTEGLVVATGPGTLVDSGNRVSSGFTVGQVVLFSDQSALRVDPDAPDQMMVEGRSILAVRA